MSVQIKPLPANYRQARSIPSPLDVRKTPDYDPALPVFDRPGVCNLCDLKGLRGITANFVKQSTIAGDLHSYKIGGRLWWSENDVTAWIHSMRRPAGGDVA